METNLSQLQKNLSRSAEIAGFIEKALNTATITVPEEKRLRAALQQIENQSIDVMSQLQQMSEQFKDFNQSAKFQLWERKLLDLTMRNNLLNMRMGSNYMPYPCDDIATLEDSLDDGNEIILNSKELKKIYRTVRTNMEETGANTLFLTLGTLCYTEQRQSYYQPDKEPTARKAPILLMPVDIVYMGKDNYAIRKRDEDIILNITLVEFLWQTFEISLQKLNPLPQDAHGIDINLVFHLVREAIKDHEDWHIEEESILGIFSFTKFVMWNDIHTHSDVLMENPMVRSIIEGRLLLPEQPEPADARNLDLTSRPNEYTLPVDADSSQLEAVIDAGQNRSFVLYGPPGTGKSQTITNIIANALSKNKRVLFVAEKKAALDVVQTRLEKIGLGPFCLELHSNKTDKKSFLQQMEDVIQFAGEKPSDNYEKLADELFNQRMKIIGYIESLHQKREKGYSLYDCIERYLSLNKIPISLPKEKVEKWNKEQVENLYERCLVLDSANSLLGMSPKEHPLRGLMPIIDNAERPKYVIASQTLEAQIATLPQAIENIKKQIERNSTMKFVNKTTRQYLEADYKWKKFMQVATVDESLIDDINALYETVCRWNDNISLLPQWKLYAEKLNELREEGLDNAISLYLQGRSGKEIADSFLAMYYQYEANRIIENDVQLNSFTGMQFEHVIEKYALLTKQFQELSQKELIAHLSVRNPIYSKNPELNAELTLLRKRIGNNGRGTSIRNIISQMPNLLPNLCPCMLMSPLSVAQYIDATNEKFDIVIFDEASQMPTCEAVGSIARGNALIVVGDPKQMPPTSFFATNVTDDEDAELDDLESILDDCIMLSMPARYLNWHYRSKHESLIAFSNMNYYDGKLVTFPSVDDMQKKVLLEHVDGVYDFGKTRTNISEAKAIVNEVMTRLDAMKSGEDYRSIGIIAFSKTQSDCIEDLMNDAFAKRPDLLAYNKESSEPLFIKNLENVQGDERDIILFSICYGPDKDGKVSMNFGPLNQNGGERRLNVAVSRARYEMKVFSTLEPEQIDERRTNALGVIGLKHFLEYAKHGFIENVKTQDETTNNITEQIAEKLTKQGYAVHTKVGTSAFKIDIAIVDPKDASRYCLGIVLDGQGYYNIKTARDREVVQPAVLQLLGWNVMHVWTLDWFKSPDVVIKQIVENIQ